MKKRVVVTASQVPFTKGGAELHVDFLVRNLIRRGFDAEVVSLPYKWYPENSLYNSMLAWRMLDLSEANGKKIDLVISTKFPSYGVKHDNKVAWVIHQFRQVYDLYETENGYSRLPEGERIRDQVMKFDRMALLESQRIFANSKNVAARLKKYNNIDSAPLYHPPSMAGRYKTGEYGDYIVSVGRLDRLKRNELLIESLKYCDKGIRAKIAGKGPEMEPLQKLAKKLGVEDRVDFLGFVPDDDLLDLYAGAFAVFFSPVDEDYGYITLEAFLSHKPVVTCKDSGGVLEFTENGVSGFVNEINPAEIGANINKLYADKKLCRDMGMEGFMRVKDISWDNVIDKLTETIR